LLGAARSSFKGVGSAAKTMRDIVVSAFNAAKNTVDALVNAIARVGRAVNNLPGAGALKKLADVVGAARGAGPARGAAAFNLGTEAAAAEELRAARLEVTNAKNKKRRDAAARALAALEARQAAAQARATAGETLAAFIQGIKDTIRAAELSRIMAPVTRARDERAARETRAARGGLEAGITRAQAEAADPRVQARYQRDAARLDARMVQARKSGNLEAIDALQAEKDALDARYGPAYLAGLRDQLAQLNENEIEASSEKAADDFVAQFSTGMDAALKELLGGGTVQAFFAQLMAAMSGSGVSPGSLPASVTTGAGEAAAVVGKAPASLGSRITGYLRGRNKKNPVLASNIAKGISPKSTQRAVFDYTGKEFGGYKIQNRASGGMLTPGMLTMVGETGPELIVGGKVNSGTRTSRMGGGQGMNITVNAVGAAADDPMLLARQLGWQLATR